MTPEGHPEKFNIGTPWHTQDAFEAAMKYRSPIEIIQGKLETKIENDIMTAVQRYGIRVDKEELIKALDYDRKQYMKGYEDGRKAFEKELLEAIEANGELYEKEKVYLKTQVGIINFNHGRTAPRHPEEEEQE